jgi:protein O-GlcNAc transferase
LEDFIAGTPRQYVELAIHMGNDLSRLRDLRATLRQRMLASPLLAAAGFTRNLETTYRQMWTDWCEQHGRGGS